MAKKNVVKIRKQGSGEVVLERVKWCSSRWCKFLGLQFRRGLQPDEGLVLVHNKDSTASTSIHMFFVFFPIAAVWVDGEGRVTSAQLAKPWRPYYASPQPARYVIEANPDLLERVKVGEILEFV